MIKYKISILPPNTMVADIDRIKSKLYNNDANKPPHIEVFKRVKQLANKKVTNGIAKRWIANELEMKKRV